MKFKYNTSVQIINSVIYSLIKYTMTLYNKISVTGSRRNNKPTRMKVILTITEAEFKIL